MKSRAMTLAAYGLTPRMVERQVHPPGPNEVRVKVRGTSVDPIDWKQASGKGRPIITAKFPGFVPGYDLSGELETLGPGVTGFSIGQRVHTRLSGRQGGCWPA